MARVSDYLSSIAFYWPIVSAQDHPSTAPVHELDASFNNTVKHVQTETVMDESTARFAVEMAKVIASDEENMQNRPPLSALICTIAPLGQDAGGMESALVFAEAGLPVGFMSMANTGSTAPATIAGTVVVADAEIVAAMVLIQMAHPGAPVFHSLMPGIMHPRTGAYLGSAWEAELYRLKGELLLMQGADEAGVEACFQRAIDVARRQSSKSLELRAAASLSRLWQKQGKKEEARELLQEIYGWFTEGFGTADLKEAKALLDALVDEG